MRLIYLLFFLCGISLVQAQEGWEISTTSTDDYTGIALSNGRLGLLSDQELFSVKHIILANVYDKESEHGVSQIVEGINFGKLTMKIDGEQLTNESISNWSQVLNLKEAYIETTFDFKNKARVMYRIYALRNVPYSGYIDCSVQAKQNIKVEVEGKLITPSDYKQVFQNYKVLKDVETTMPILQTYAETEWGKHKLAAGATFIWHDINSSREHQRPKLTHRIINEYEHSLAFSKEVSPQKPLEFAWAGSITTTKDFQDPLNESERMTIFNLLNSRDVLLDAHNALWEELWNGDIEIEGDLASQLDVRLALYHLYSFARNDADLSIAPMGLSTQIPYNGHIFWDTELWMYPPILVFHQDIAESLVNYRYNLLDKAKQRANTYGYQGAMYPWESDDTGEEATPPFALTGPFEHHITADIGIAFWNYFRVTGDKQWLQEKGYPVLKEVADFWASRAVRNSDGSYSINNVVGANEFAPNVNDNAFTNGSAITALVYASQAASVLGVEPNPQWKIVAEHITIHQFPDGTTMEHSEYDGDIIKQADVNLLAYPLSIVQDKKRIIQDLEYYEPKLSPEGPAMGKSVFSVIYSRLGDQDNAFRLFQESYLPNRQEPFGALSEVATSNYSYFVTGAGGMLQAVLFGFAGLEITDQGIIQNKPNLPKQWKSLTIKGVGPESKSYTITH